MMAILARLIRVHQAIVFTPKLFALMETTAPLIRVLAVCVCTTRLIVMILTPARLMSATLAIVCTYPIQIATLVLVSLAMTGMPALPIRATMATVFSHFQLVMIMTFAPMIRVYREHVLSL